jgi:hypothetical protein
MSIGVATASAAAQFEGKVVGVSKERRTFRLADAQRGTIRIKVTRNTTFEDIAGFGALRVGMRRVEATVKRSDGRWVAILSSAPAAAGTTAATTEPQGG